MGRNQTIKTFAQALLWGCIVILFTVASGVVCSVVPSVNTQEKIWLVQGIFSWLSLVPAYLHMKHNHDLPYPLVKGAKHSMIWYLPCLLILAPMLIGGFANEGMSYYLISLFFTLAVGVSEELYFRGIVIERLQKNFSEKGIVLLSTLIFGLGHASAALSGMDTIGVIMTVINALIFGWLAIELLMCSKVLLPLMIFHCLFDWLSKIVPLEENVGMTVDIIRGTIMFIFVFILFILRTRTKKVHCFVLK